MWRGGDVVRKRVRRGISCRFCDHDQKVQSVLSFWTGMAVHVCPSDEIASCAFMFWFCNMAAVERVCCLLYVAIVGHKPYPPICMQMSLIQRTYHCPEDVVKRSRKLRKSHRVTWKSL